MTQTLNIYQKIIQAMGHNAVLNCPKAGDLKIGGISQYKYFKAEDVVNASSKAFREFGIVFTTVIDKIEHTTYRKVFKSGEKDMHYFVLTGEAIFTNADKPDDKIQIPFLGSAEDESDKAIGKANTYAKKIALMNILMIQDGEDTDAISSEAGLIKETQTMEVKSLVEKPKKQSIEVFTSDEEFKANLVKAGFSEKESYKSKGAKVMQGWFELEKVSTIKERLKANAYFYNAEKGYYELV